ncbi:MAG TPA: hypothetical protein VH062_01235 [Polyangiaceae bacterium]|jgi:hypothetical protein|nr:hypothetical protein [Polyangiaceae bacterium]
MTHLDDDAEAFFRRGEEGTYDGGPASLLPFATDEQPDSAPSLGSTLDQLERRRKFARLVTTIVGSLGAVLVLAVLLGAHARAVERDTADPHGATTVEPARAPLIHVESPPVTQREPEATPMATAATEMPAKVPSKAVQRRHPARAPRALSVKVQPRAVHAPPTANFPD